MKLTVVSTIAHVGLGFAVTPLFLFALIILLCCRLTVHIVLWLTQPGYNGLLEILELFFDREAHGALSITNILAKVELTDLKSAEELMERALKLGKKCLAEDEGVKLRCKVDEWWGFRYWRTVDINIERQIRFFGVSSEDELKNFVSEIAVQPIHGNRLWEVLICDRSVDGLYPVILRAHETLGDGYALRQLLIGLRLNSKTEFEPDQKHPGFFEKILKGDYSALRNVLSSLSDVLLLFWCAPVLSLFQYMRPVDDNSLRSQKLTTEKHLRWTKGSFKKMKELHRTTKMAFTEILLMAMSKSFDDTFKSRDETVNQVTVAFPMRKSQDSSGLANEFIPVGLKLPVDTKRRVRDVVASYRCLKSSPSFLINYFVPRYLFLLFPMKLPKWTLKATEFTCVLSNFPGPPEKVTFDGFECKECLFFVNNTHDNNGLAISITSYNEDLTFAITMDSTLIRQENDAQNIIDGMVNHVDELYANYCC